MLRARWVRRAKVGGGWRPGQERSAGGENVTDKRKLTDWNEIPLVIWSASSVSWYSSSSRPSRSALERFPNASERRTGRPLRGVGSSTSVVAGRSIVGAAKSVGKKTTS